MSAHSVATELGQREEIEAALARYIELRNHAQNGIRPWSALADLFVAETEYVDSVWGRVRGIKNIRRVLDQSMQGIDDWCFVYEWHVIDGARAVMQSSIRLPGVRADGSYYQLPSLLYLYYAGCGKFNYSEELVNIAHLMEVINESGWTPGPGFTFPEKVAR